MVTIMKGTYVFLAFIAAILLSINCSAQPPNTWTQKAIVGGGGREAAVGFSIGTKGYIGTGNILNNVTNDFWEYNPSTNVWTQKANFGGLPRWRAVGFSIGAKGYIGTGGNGSNYYNDFWEYDTTANVWTQKANFGGNPRLDAVGFNIGTRGYLGTGSPGLGPPVNEFWEYNPASDTWTQKANFGGSPRFGASGFCIGANGYIGCGRLMSLNFVKDFWKYDTTNNTWTQIADFGGTAREWAVGFSIGNQGYIGTGIDLNSYYNDFWEYDPSSNTWTQKANFGGSPRFQAVGFCIGSKGYIGTGSSNVLNYTSDFWQYTPTCILPQPPTNTTAPINQNICVGSTTTLSASGIGTLGWYTASTGGTWLGSGNSFTTPVLTANTTYYVQDSTCGPSPTRTAIPVTVYPVPSPTIIGQTSMCINSGYYNYSTEPGMQNYSWAVSSGGIINYGLGTNQIQVSWITAGPQTVSVIYSNGSCSPSQPTVLNITVNPLPDQAGIITGIANVCAGSNNIPYAVASVPNTTTYVWALPQGESIASGAGTNSITVNFDTNTVAGNIIVYGNNLCGDGGASPAFLVSITALPDQAGTITGPTPVCQGDTGMIYSVPPIYGANGYTWALPSGASTIGSSNSNIITVNFSNNAASGNITVYGSNSCGNGNVSPVFPVTVNNLPPTPSITNTGDTLHSSSPTGNQWYFEGNIISGATSQTCVADQEGYYWVVVTSDGCPSDTSNHKLILLTGMDTHSSATINIYPVPNEGRFNVIINTTKPGTFSVTIYSILGVKIYEEKNVEVNGLLQKVIDLRPVPEGVYTIIFKGNHEAVIRKIVVRND
jgi:N-acetylneuraminic acid mutarotase